MKLSQLAAKPQLTKVILDDEATIEEIGEAVEFWTWDRQPLDVFMKLVNQSNANPAEMIDLVRTLILDEDGKQIVTGENMLPSSLLMRSISKIVEALGK